MPYFKIVRVYIVIFKTNASHYGYVILINFPKIRCLCIIFELTLDNMVIHYLNTQPRDEKLDQKTRITSFNKIELNMILSIYGKNVSNGIWRDYAIDHNENTAVFSIYRSTFEKAFLQIIKNKKSLKKQKKYLLLNAHYKKLKDSNELISIINFLDFSLKRIV